MPRNTGTAEQLFAMGSRLRTVREALGLTQVDICVAIGVRTTTWNHWEKGRRRPDPVVLADFADRYGVTIDWVYRGEMGGLPLRLAERIRAELTGEKLRVGAKREDKSLLASPLPRRDGDMGQ